MEVSSVWFKMKEMPSGPRLSKKGMIVIEALIQAMFAMAHSSRFLEMMPKKRKLSSLTTCSGQNPKWYSPKDKLLIWGDTSSKRILHVKDLPPWPPRVVFAAILKHNIPSSQVWQLRDPLYCCLISLPERLKSFVLSRKDLIWAVLIEYASMNVNSKEYMSSFECPRSWGMSSLNIPYWNSWSSSDYLLSI